MASHDEHLRHSQRVSPTAHYTSQVWVRHGLSQPAFDTRKGRILWAALRPFNFAYEHLTDRASLDETLLGRHTTIDAALEEAIAGGVSQVVEIAAGLSARGWRMVRKHPGLRYIEADLPDMAAHKRALLGPTEARHEVVALDAFSRGDDGLEALGARLDPARGLAVITEGLINYFDTAAVGDLWQRIAAVSARFSQHVYICDIVTGDRIAGMRGALVFRALLSAFAGGTVTLHFSDGEAALEAARVAGFGRAELREAPGKRRGGNRILVAR
jgi:O-methyltransferase involved in polyketide biosynthesis